LTEAERAALNALLTVDPELRRSRFAWLRDYSESPAPSNILELLSRLEYARALKIDPERAGRIHAARLGRLVDEGAIMTVQHIVDLEPARRTAILVAQVADVEARLADATLAMFEKYMGSLFTKARNRDERRFQATKRDVAKALLLFRRTSGRPFFGSGTASSNPACSSNQSVSAVNPEAGSEKPRTLAAVCGWLGT
jgi:hypothetical protein